MDVLDRGRLSRRERMTKHGKLSTQINRSQRRRDSHPLPSMFLGCSKDIGERVLSSYVALTSLNCFLCSEMSHRWCQIQSGSSKIRSLEILNSCFEFNHRDELVCLVCRSWHQLYVSLWSCFALHPEWRLGWRRGSFQILQMIPHSLSMLSKEGILTGFLI